MHGRRGYQLKEASVADASATPPTTGTREPTTHAVGFCWKTNVNKPIKITKTNSQFFKNQKDHKSCLKEPNI